MVDQYFVVEIRDKFTGAREEVEESKWFGSRNRSEVEARVRELNDELTAEARERFECVCSEPKTSFRGLQMESLREPYETL